MTPMIGNIKRNGRLIAELAILVIFRWYNADAVRTLPDKIKKMGTGIYLGCQSENISNNLGANLGI
jgi:hypothetical protein